MRTLLSCLPILLLLCACTTREHAGNYGDVTVSYPGATIHGVKGTCDTHGNVVSQDDPSCVGKVISAEQGGPTITVLDRGAALPVEAVDTGALAPPPR